MSVGTNIATTCLVGCWLSLAFPNFANAAPTVTEFVIQKDQERLVYTQRDTAADTPIFKICNMPAANSYSVTLNKSNDAVTLDPGQCVLMSDHLIKATLGKAAPEMLDDREKALEWLEKRSADLRNIENPTEKEQVLAKDFEQRVEKMKTAQQDGTAQPDFAKIKVTLLD